jgi:starch synthase
MFEHCGLSQLISLRYGTLPITRETGGLRDTVLSYNEYTGDGNGFTFFNYNAHDMLHVIERAVGMYKNDRETFEFLARRAMGGEYGWDKSAAKYVELYEDLTGQTGTAPIEATAEAPADEAEKPKPARKPRAKKEAESAEPAKKPRAKKAETAEEKPAPKKRTSKKAKTEE